MMKRKNQCTNVIQHDDISHASSLTDITDNTGNRKYFNKSESVVSKGSTLSITSLKESDLNEVITEDMSPEEIESSIQTLVQLQINQSKARARGLIEKAQQLQKQKQLLNAQNEEQKKEDASQKEEQKKEDVSQKEEQKKEDISPNTDKLVRGKQKPSNDEAESINHSVKPSNNQHENDDLSQSGSNCGATIDK